MSAEPIAQHNHPPMVTCPPGCLAAADSADLHSYADPGFTVVAEGDSTADTAGDNGVDSPVDNPAPDSESAQVSGPAEGDTPVDTSGDSEPDDGPPGETPKERKNRKAREKRARDKRDREAAAAAAAGEEVEPNAEPTPEPEPSDPPADEPEQSTGEKIEAALSKDRKPRGKTRKSGDSAAQEESVKQADEMTEPMEVKAAKDVESEADWFRAPGFQRMKTAWEGPDKQQMDRVQFAIDTVVIETFREAYVVMSDLYDIVRECEVNEATGEVRLDPHGFKIWKRHPVTGVYIEDWSLLTIRDREHFLFRITSSLFDWEQKSADLWTRAMFSKGMFVEKFSIEYDAPMSGTIDDRNARGNVEAAEDRYFALMNSAVSRKAEALCRTMTNLQLRLKDVLGQ